MAQAVDPLVSDIIETAARLKTERAVFDEHWAEIHRYVFPSVTPPSRDRIARPGEKAHADVLDNTAEVANEFLAAAVTDALTPETIDWFALRVTDDEALNRDRDVAVWLEDCTSRMMSVFRSPRAGYGQASHEMRTDLVTFGTGGMGIFDAPGEGIHFVAVPLNQLFADADSRGRVIAVYRCFDLAAKEAFAQWGEAAGPTVCRSARSQSPEERARTYPFIHVVMTRRERDPSQARIDNRHKAWASVVVSVTDKVKAEESGFDHNPFVVPRWTKRAGETYGRSPAMKTLGDVKMLQRTARVNIGGAELTIRPPMLVPDDGVLGPVRMTAGGLTNVRADLLQGQGSPIRPLLNGARPDIGEELMAAIRARIDNAYFKPLIQMVRKDRMTATEVLEVMAQNQRILSPFLGRLKAEDVGPTVERVFAIMLRGGGFLPMPPQLRGRDIGVEYVSPLVKRQRLEQARGLAQFMEITTPLAAHDPTVWDNFDTDTIMRDTADIMGLYKDWMRAPGQVDAIRAERRKAQEAASRRQAVSETAGAAADAAKAAGALHQAGLIPGGMAAPGAAPALRQTLASPTEAFQ